MGEPTKWEKARKWIVIFVPFATVVLTWWLSTKVVDKAGEEARTRQLEMQLIEQERSNDIAIAQTVLDVLAAGNPDLYDWLPELVATIKDSTLREVMSRGVIANPVVPKAVKETVLERVPSADVDLSGIQKEFKTQTSILDSLLKLELLKSQESERRTGEKSETKGRDDAIPITDRPTVLDEPTCIVVYLRGDRISEYKAYEIWSFLEGESFDCSIEGHSRHWYDINWIRDSTRTGEIWFDLQDYGNVRSYGYKIRETLNKKGTWGSFELAKEAVIYRLDEIPFNSILVVLPPDTL